MNTKAFTLVELIAIVSILTLIFLVAFPNLLLVSKSSNNEKVEITKKNLCLAGENFIYNNLNTTLDDGTTISINAGQSINIKIQYLIDAGLVDEKDESVSSKYLKFKVLSDKTLKCEIN